MEMGRTVRLQLVLATGFIAAWLAAPPGADSEDAHNRSIYVPIELELCEHIKNAALFHEGTRIRALPGQQTVQFTYYGNLGRLLPESEVFRVTGTEESGRDFEVKVVVTPDNVYVADRRIDLHPEEQLKDLDHKLDVRYHRVTLHLNCSESCPRRSAANTVAP